ncbi:MAG: hypothetical protein AAB597_01130 [Patescibacteria group bacterium]
MTYAPAINLPVAAEMTRQLKPEGLIVMSADAKRIDSFFYENGVGESILFWHVIVPLGDSFLFKPERGVICRDLQAFPGVSLGLQCPELGKKINEYHPSEDYYWEEDGGMVLATGIKPGPIPLLRFEVGPGKLKKDICSCGKNFRIVL